MMETSLGVFLRTIGWIGLCAMCAAGIFLLGYHLGVKDTQARHEQRRRAELLRDVQRKWVRGDQYPATAHDGTAAEREITRYWRGRLVNRW